MSIEVALIDFPRLQEQITSRLLSEHNVNTQRMATNEAESRLGLFQMALFFWPDTRTDNAERLKQIKAACAVGTPVILVASESGRKQIENDKQQGEVTDILVTPLQPHVISRALSQHLGLQKPKPQSVDAGYVTPFVEGTVDTMKQMAQMECTRSNLSVKMDGKSSGDISGVMGLSGTAEGFVAVTFKNALARKIVAKMLMMSVEELTEDDIRDGVGEFMNVVAGAAKGQLVNTEHGFQLSLPTVIVGGPHSVGQPRGVPVLCIEFTTEGDKFEVLVCLHPKKT